MSVEEGSARFVAVDVDEKPNEGSQLPLDRGLAWLGLCYQVSTNSHLTFFQRRRHHAQKQIIRDVSGFVRAGEILFIMGPSGSGKTSTLDTLAMRVKGSVQGQVWVDGQVCNEMRFRSAAKYVEQNNILFDTLTAFETLTVGQHSNNHILRICTCAHLFRNFSRVCVRVSRIATNSFLFMYLKLSESFT
jgi:ABC-type multidrug transport system fused ATPase/permease subunit